MRRLLTVILGIVLSIPVLAQMTIKDGMVQIADRHGVNFVYDPSLPVDSPYNGRSLSRGSLDDNLASLFKGSGIVWEKRKQFVVLTAAKPEIPIEIYATISDRVPDADTLLAAVKTDTKRLDRSIGHLQTGLEGIRGIISPLGEGDPIRWAQAMPGVTTGADGATAMYVRGGNSGNNLFSLDDVPVYGYAHILGLTTIVPSQVMESAALSKGGFDGAESNFTSAHLRIVSKAPSERQQTSFAINNFLVSASAEGPISNKLSYLISARISPLSLEYKAVRGALPSILSGLDNFKATVGDAYAKLQYKITSRHTLDASFLGSIDNYGFDTPDSSHEVMGWNNMVGMLRYRWEGDITKFDVTASINKYGSQQKQDKTFRGAENHLSLQSNLMEYGLKAGLSHAFLNGRFTLGEGANLRYATFAPGQVGEETRSINTLLATGWLQGEFKIPDHLYVKGAFRLNHFRNYDLLPTEGLAKPFRVVPGKHTNPEYELSLKWNITEHFAFEATYDKMFQYYHTLEGLPIGWSLDMIVPTGESVLPESSEQGSVNFAGEFGAHSISIGGFYKRLENLIYYKYSQALFSGALSTWEQDVELGNGRSYGLEALYEYAKGDWYARVSYTLSKTTREDFPSFYDGAPFHARFDRLHVLNATAQWKGLTATLILQSGGWENGAAETYKMPFLGTDFVADFFSGVNNYHMPTVFRLDLGYQFDFKTGNVDHTLNLSICNVTNHFNPFMLYYDTNTESWKEMALLPIMPNLSYKISF